MKQKPKVLLCWGYHRSGYVKIFNALNENFEFTYINYIFQEAEANSFTKDKKVYWSDFRNIDDLLLKTQPDKVVFMGIDSPLTILLNVTCKARGIKTCFIQHGIFDSYQTYLDMEKLERKNPPNSTTINQPSFSNKKFGIYFLLRSFSFETISAYGTILLLFIFSKILKSHQKAVYFLKFNSRIANIYLVFTKFCAQVLNERDGVPTSLMIEIGNPEADEIINNHEYNSLSDSSEFDYFLLIDNVLAEAEGYPNSPVTKQNVNEFYFKLNEYAHKQGKKLYIKLHPFSYKSTFFIKDENIVYVRDVDDMGKLIRNSYAVFGNNSTLLIPALALKKCCLFKLTQKSLLLDYIEQINYCPVLDYFSFQTNDIRFNDKLSAHQQDDFYKAYLYKIDGQSMERIKHNLLSPI